MATAPGTETEVVETEVKVETAKVETEAKPEVKVETKTETEVETTVDEDKPDWRDARIKVLTAKLHAEREKNAKTEVKPETNGNDPAEFERRVQTEAERRASVAEFNRQCNDVAVAGRLAFPDFDTRVNALRSIVDQDSLPAYNAFLSAAIETGEASKLLHALGGDLNEAARLLNLPPVRMAVELTKLAANPAKLVSKAPKPIAPIDAGGDVKDPINPDDPVKGIKLSTQEWMKRREAQAKERGIQ